MENNNMQVDVATLKELNPRAFVELLKNSKGEENYLNVLKKELTRKQNYLEDLIKEIALLKIEMNLLDAEIKSIEQKDKETSDE